MDESNQHRTVVKFLFSKGFKPEKITQRMKDAYGESAPIQMQQYIVGYSWIRTLRS